MKKFLYNITSGHPKELIVPSILSLLEGIFMILPFGLILDIVNTIYTSFAHQTTLDISRLWLPTSILIAWLLVQYLVSAIAYDKTYFAAYNSSANGRIALGERLRKLSLGFFNSKDPGDLTTMILGDYASVEKVISHFVPQLISAIALPIIAFVSLLFIDWKMSAAMFVALPITLSIVGLTSKLQKRLGKTHVKAKVDSASRLQEYLLGIREIKAHNLSGKRFIRLKEAFHRLMKESIKIEGAMGPIMLFAIGFLRAGFSIMIFIGSYSLVGGQLTLPVFLMFLLIANRIYEPMTVVLINFAELRYAALSAERIMEIHKEQPLQGKGIQKKTIGKIKFENVTFGYQEEDVLKDVSFTIEPCSITALVGPSGSGKSTITRLIARFWDIEKGSILLDNKDIRELHPEKYLEKISMVFQDVYLFKDSIGNNIRVGNQNATQEEVEWAAKQACCHEFIMKLPKGYDTPIGEGGCTLSGGEKQRISIARALLKDAPIVLLDEATASLDPENELQVQRAINTLVNNKTVIIIAHRLKTIRNADNIIVLDNGIVKEQGQHQELIRNGDLYSKLWHFQQESIGWTMKTA
jgi:ATP-binding cassette, subfamily B, bacterial IrtB/YbtQ